ncbi:MAG: hypothetical protein RI985_1340 [Chloroflexota bacterium]|jgi:hypothetical protein
MQLAQPDATIDNTTPQRESGGDLEIKENPTQIAPFGWGKPGPLK